MKRANVLLLLTVLAGNATPSTSQTESEEYSLRLHSDYDKAVGNGVLEVTYRGTSGGICADGWGDMDARVVCIELGFQHGTARTASKTLSDIDGPYMTSNVNCIGTENTLGQCSFTPFRNVQRCNVDRLAAVRCHNFDVQLYTKNPEKSYGAVVFNQTGGSRVLCSDGFDQNAATVVCKQLGFRYGLSACCSAFGPAEFHTDIQNRFTTDTVKCDGTEQHLSECTFSNEVGDAHCTKSVTIGNECLQYCKSSPGEPCNVHYDKLTRCSWTRYAGVVCADEDRGFTRITADPIVKINYYTHDGYVCTGDFTDQDASVVCRSTGFLYGIAFKAASTAILHEIRWLRGLGCTGTENSISDCNHHEWGHTENCQWDSVAAVMCSNNQGDLDVQIRVVDGPESNTPENTSISGRVEVYLNGKWGTVCGKYLNHTEARVLCRQLGYLGGLKLQAGSYGPGTGDVILSGIDCEGGEENIRDCIWYGYSQNMCAHSVDAAITCFKNVRLADTKSQNYGILEMFDYGYKFPEKFWNITEDSFKWYDIDWLLGRNSGVGKWWAICDTNVKLDPTFICKQWGFQTGVFRRGSPFGPTTSELSDVERYCSDPLDNSCPYNKFSGSCSSGKYMALYCSGDNIEKEEFEVDIPPNSFYGPVIVKRYGLTGYICSDGFDDKEAHVVCSQLGYASGNAVKTFTADLAIIQGAVECKGTETRLEDCKRGSFYENTTCSVFDTVAAVICYNDDGPRIVNTNQNVTVPANMRLEIIVDQTSMFVSASNFEDADASVFCRSIGYAGGIIKTINSTIPYGLHHVSNLTCFGNESSILECPGIWDPRLVGSDSDIQAFANCRPEVYLTGSDRSFYGAVVVTTREGSGLVGVWSFDDDEAQAVCHALGFVKGLFICCDPFGQLTEQVFLASFHCSGFGNKVSEDCTYDVDYSYTRGLQRHTDYASVVCSNERTESKYSLSVHRGGVFGPLVLTYMNVDGNICSKGWDNRDANVACREMGLSAGMAYFGEIASVNLKDQFWTSNVNCNGTEDKLEDCSLTAFGKVRRCYNKFSSVICYGSEGIQYRLAGNETRQGRVEMSLFGDWKSICSEYWTDEDAHVLCRMLGYAAGQKIETVNSKPHWNISFNCNKSSKSLNDCWDMSRTCYKSNVGAGAFCYKSVKLSTGVGREYNSGEVLLYQNDEWHYLCSDDFTKTSARIVCKELGFVDGDAICCSGDGSLNAIPKLQTHKVMCSGTETSVSECLVEGSCKGSGHAYVICSDTTQDKLGKSDQDKGSKTVVIAVVVSLLALVCLGLIVLITVCYIRRKKRRQHNLSVKYSQART